MELFETLFEYLIYIYVGIGLLFLLYIFFSFATGRKVKDEPIEGLYCKFCGKAQSQCGKYDTDCPHQWQEKMK